MIILKKIEGIIFISILFKFTCNRKLMQCKIIKNNEIACYFVTEYSDEYTNWEEKVQNLFDGQFKFYSQVVEIRPYM